MTGRFSRPHHLANGADRRADRSQMPAKPGRGFFPKAHTNAGRKPSRLQAEANAADRRKGEEWYASAINSWEPRKIEIDTSFLGDGKWRVEIFEDGINADRDATDYVKKSQTVTAGEKLAVTLAPGGGWTAHFVRKGFLW